MTKVLLEFLPWNYFTFSGHFHHCIVSHHDVIEKGVFLNTWIPCRGSAAGWRVKTTILLIEVRFRKVCVVVEATAS